MKCFSNIYFNRQCLIKKIIPNWAKIMSPHISPVKEITRRKVQTTRLRMKSNFLYTNIAKLNNELYRIHLKGAQECGNTRYSILSSVHEAINQELERKYETIKKTPIN